MSLKLLRVFGTVTEIASPRPGQRRFGVPDGGPRDRTCEGLLRALLRLQPSTPILEIAGSAEWIVQDDGCIAHVGAGEVRVAGRTGRDQARTRVSAGDRIEILATRDVALAYLGFTTADMAAIRLAELSPSIGVRHIHFLPSPHSDLAAKLAGEWEIGSCSDRVGTRLIGRILPHSVEAASEPTVAGAIQLPSGGEPIVLGPEGPTLGGYPVVGVLADADRDAFAQIPIGAKFRLAPIGWDEARARREAQQRALAERIARLQLT